MAPGEASVAEAASVANDAFSLVLEPEAGVCAGLGAIRIDENLFAIGRNEAPFASRDEASVAQLSRRHARIFVEEGAAYAADLGSKNGTTVNGVVLREEPVRLRNGDVICFGAKLAFRVRMAPRAGVGARPAPTIHAILTPLRGDIGLDAIEILQFPFLVSKTDAIFAKYRDRYPHQVNYLSRRHAHIFLKGAAPCVEDLGSTNGTFVDGVRLDAAAVTLAHGSTLAFGGNHFAYTVSLTGDTESSPTTTEARTDPPLPEVDPDKTTFVTAAHSFLDIFCVDQAGHPDDEINHDAALAAQKPSMGRGQHPRSAFRRRGLWVAAIGIGLVGALAASLYLTGGSERRLETEFAKGDYRLAAVASNTYLQSHPNDARALALNTEALFKGTLPGWLTHIKEHDFDAARAAVSQMKALAAHNADARDLVDEIDWMGGLEAFVNGPGREGADPPIRIFSDEDRMRALLGKWQADIGAHQRRLDRIESIVPDFREPYALTLSHLRKLQSDDSVYLAAIDRLKASISRDLEQGHPEALKDEIADYADKYPRLAGLDTLQTDLARYLALDQALRSRKLGSIVEQMQQAQFRTPPFQGRMQQLGPMLPAQDIVVRYGTVSNAWKSGQAAEAIAGLRSMPPSPWRDAVQDEIAHDQSVFAQYNDLQKSRNAPDHDDHVLSYYESLDPKRDVWFVNAVQPDIAALKTKAIARAQDEVGRAQAAWAQYRKNGAIAGEQRLETSVSDSFSKQAHLLVDARSQASHAARMLHQLKADSAAAADQLLAQIDAEAQLQRRSLADLGMVLDPGVLSAKLALLNSPKE
jgi:pSer/pThr/pTyr-binding forkhead associated (FHA) protein